MRLISIFLWLIIGATPILAHGNTERDLIDRKEDLERRSTNSRVWSYVFQVEEPTLDGTTSGRIRTETAEVIEKADSLFYLDRMTNQLKETETSWSKEGDKFTQRQRKDELTVEVEELSGKTTLTYAPSQEGAFECKILRSGLFDPSSGKFIQSEELSNGTLVRSEKSNILSGGWDSFGFEAVSKRNGVQLNLVIHSEESLPSIPVGPRIRDLHFGMEYEIKARAGGIRVFQNDSPLVVGSSVSGSSLLLGLGLDSEKEPSALILPSSAYSRGEAAQQRLTNKIVTVESDRVRIVEGAPLGWLKQDDIGYPVAIDPNFYTRPSENGFLLGDVWESGKTYYISSDVYLLPDQHLVIEPRAVIKIDGHSNPWDAPAIKSYDGTITIAGEPYNHAVVTSADDDSVGVVLQEREGGLHGGIQWISIPIDVGGDWFFNPNGSAVSHLKISNGHFGLYFHSFFPPASTNSINPTVRDSIFGNLKYHALFFGIANQHPTNPESAFGDIHVVNNLFKNPSAPSHRIADVLLHNQRENEDLPPEQLRILFSNNTFASENPGSYNHYASCIELTAEGEFDGIVEPCFDLTLRNNIFCRYNGNSAIHFRREPLSGHGAVMQIRHSSNVDFRHGEELLPFLMPPLESGNQGVESKGQGEDLLLITESPFDDSISIGDYYIKSDVIEDFEDAGSGSAAEYGLTDKSIFPPAIYSGSLSQETVWSRQETQRDEGVVDIGYHYDAVDVVMEGVSTNGNVLKIEPGTVITAIDSTLTNSQLEVDGGALLSEGFPGEVVRWIPYTATGDLIRSPKSGAWWGIKIFNNPTEVLLRWNLFEFPLLANAIASVETSNAVILNVLIENNLYNESFFPIYHMGKSENESGVLIRNNRVFNARHTYGIAVDNSDAIVVNNTISTLKPVLSTQEGIQIAGGSKPIIAYNVIQGGKNAISVLENSALTDPIIQDNIGWNLEGSALTTPNVPTPTPHHNFNKWDLPLNDSPYYVSSREFGFQDDSEHFFLPSDDADASRVPLQISDLDDSEGILIDNITISTGGMITVYCVDSGLNIAAKGMIDDSEEYFEDPFSDGTIVESAAIVFQGPIAFGENAEIVLKTSGGSELRIAIPAEWLGGTGDDIDVGVNWCFWIALDGSLYYGRTDHSSWVPTACPTCCAAATPVPSCGGCEDCHAWNQTATYAIKYDPSPSGELDLDSEFAGGLAATTFGTYGQLSGAQAAVASPDKNIDFYPYPGTSSQFHRDGQGVIVAPTPSPFSDLDIGFHGFRGRTWVRNDENIQLSWDPPHEHPVAIDHYKATLYKGEVEIDSVQVQEDEPIDARALNGNEPLDEIGPDDEDPYEIRLSAFDTNSNEGPESVVRFGVDRTPPMLSITSSIEPTGLSDMVHIEPETGKTYYHEDVPSNVTSFDLDFSVSDATSGVWKSIHMEDASDENVRDVYRETDSILGIDFTHDLNGTGSSRFRAYDLAGNAREIVFEMDDVPPAPYAAWTNLVAGVVDGGVLVGVIGAVEGGSGLRKMQLLVEVPSYSSPLVVQEWDSNHFGSGYEQSIGWSIDHLPPTSRWVEEVVQDYKIYVKAWDNVGNMGESEKLSFEVPNDDPEGETIYVDWDSEGTTDGTSWQAAFNTIEEAINVASNGDRIFVAEGVYAETISVHKRVNVYGGFAGLRHPLLALIPEEDAEIEESHRHIVENNLTILTSSDPSTSILYNGINSHFAYFDGLTFTGGTATGSHGGAVNCDSFSPTFVNCVFANNRTNTEGGAVYCDYSFPQFLHCTFASNVSDGNGGAIACRNGSRVDLRNCIVWGNETTGGEGDEIFVDGTSEANVNYSCVREGWNGGVGNIDGDPKFVNPAEDWRLRHDTSCANAGDLGLVSEIDRDILGDPRVPGESGGFDLGAYELEKRLTGSTGVRVLASSSLTEDHFENFLLQGEAFAEFTPDDEGRGEGWVSNYEGVRLPTRILSYFDMDPTLWFDLGSVHYLTSINVWNFIDDRFANAGIRDVRISYSIDGIDYTVLEPEPASEIEGLNDKDGFPRFALNYGSSQTTIPLGVQARYVRFDHSSPYNVCLDCSLSNVDCQACCDELADCECVRYDPSPSCSDCQVECDGSNCPSGSDCVDESPEPTVCPTCAPTPCPSLGACNDGSCDHTCDVYICEDYGTCPASRHPEYSSQRLGHTRSLGEVQFVGYPMADFEIIPSVGVSLAYDGNPHNDPNLLNLIDSSQTEHLRSSEPEEMWLANPPNEEGAEVTFSLGGHYLVDGITLWNYNPGDSDTKYGLKAVSLSVAVDPDLDGTPSSYLGMPTPVTTPTPIPTAPGDDTVSAMPLELPGGYPFKAGYVKFHDMLNSEDDPIVGLSEVRFVGRRIAVPEGVTLSSTPVPELTDAIQAEKFSSTASADMWTGSLDDEIEFDFGKTMFLRSVRFWNWNDPGSPSKGARTIAIFADDSFEPTMRISLAKASGLDSYRGESFDLGGLTATKARLKIESNHGGAGVGLSEVVFFGEMEYSSKLLDIPSTGSFTDSNRYYVDQFEFFPEPTASLEENYAARFSQMNDRWNWGKGAAIKQYSPPIGYRPAVWYGAEDSIENFKPSSTEACEEAPDCFFVSYGLPADFHERLEYRTPYPTPATTDVPTPIPNPSCEGPSYWYLPTPVHVENPTAIPPSPSHTNTIPPTPEYNPQFPYEFRPWGETPGVLFESAATPTPAGTPALPVSMESDDGHSFWIRMNDGEHCAPVAIKSAWNEQEQAGTFFHVENEADVPNFDRVPLSQWMDLTFKGENQKVDYGWHIFRADFSNLSGTSQNIAFYKGDGFQIQYEFLTADTGVSRVGTTVYTNDSASRNPDGSVASVERIPKPARMGGPEGDDKGTDLTKGYHLYRIFVGHQDVRMYIDDHLIVDWRGHGLLRKHPDKGLLPYFQYNVHGWIYSGGKSFWVNDESYVENPVITELGGDYAISPGDDGYDASKVDPDFRIDYYLHIPLGVDPEEVYRVDR